MERDKESRTEVMEDVKKGIAHKINNFTKTDRARAIQIQHMRDLNLPIPESQNPNENGAARHQM